ncbi:O-antigen ligase [uncultured Megasphaera sp.]|uniref:O-antigen ligase family protein n=1 Tax=uncultured Megasphaera sp. TaxID=165188 RepID=UPI00260057D1|nr:O-antigen ligase family protein [uncultured Megasphaera sp.]
MDYWQKFQAQWLAYVPLFLLTLSCGIDSGSLMTAAFVMHLIVCRKKKISVWGEGWKTPLFRQTVIVIVLSLACLAVTLPFNGGHGELILKFLERMIPLVLAVILIRPGRGVFPTVWAGVLLSLVWYIGDTCLHPVWEAGRLFGSFSSPNSLAGILILLLPVALFGIIRWYRACPKAVGAACLVSMIALGILIATGSRNAYISFAVTFFLLLYFSWRQRDWLVVKVMAACIVAACLVFAVLAPGLVSQRLNKDVRQDGRVYLMQVAVQLIEETPLVGVGLGNWGKVYHERFEADNPNHEVNMQSPHNIYLQIWSESGLIGLAGFLGLIIFQLKILLAALYRFYKKQAHGFPWLVGVSLPVFVIFIFGLFDYDFFSRHMMHLYWFYWGLCLYAVQYYIKES